MSFYEGQVLLLRLIIELALHKTHRGSCLLFIDWTYCTQYPFARTKISQTITLKRRVITLKKCSSSFRIKNN